MYEAFEKMRSITVKNFNQNFRIDSVNKIDFVIVEKEDIPKLIEILNILKGRWLNMYDIFDKLPKGQLKIEDLEFLLFMWKIST